LYLICARKVKDDEFTGEPGKICYMEVDPEAKRYGPSDVIKESVWFDQVRNLADGDANPTSTSPTGDVLIFVHGYNNDIETVLWRQRQLQKDLEAEGWKGVVGGFDWPSEDSTLNYLEDRSDAAEVAASLVRNGISRLASGQKAGCQTNVHLLGHSTGAYVIMEASPRQRRMGRCSGNRGASGRSPLLEGMLRLRVCGWTVSGRRPCSGASCA
jgi:pimeloyl-ACP methyl ester carboxylesterase